MVSVHDKEEVKFFLDELNENLDYLDDAIITLEQNPNDAETIEEVFRVAHTIKGSAGFLDLKNLVALGHSMENVFQEIKDGNIQISTEVINTILECKDTIGQIGHLLGQEQDSEQIDTSILIKKVNSFLDSKAKPAAPAKEKAPASNGNYGGIQASDFIPGTTLVRVWISPEEPAPAIRAFLVQKNLSEIGDIIQQSPTEEEMDSEDFVFPDERILKFWLQSDADERRTAAVANVDLIDKVEVIPENIMQSIAASRPESQDARTATPAKDDVEVTETVRIPVQRLDIMLNLVGELVIANSGFSQIQEKLRDFAGMDDIYRHVRDRTKDLIRISADIQDLVMKSRLVPISQVFNRFKRFVRDYSSRSGKKIQLLMTGENTEIDKKIIDEMIKPLTHLVRNSLDHGIESPEERRKAGKNPVGRLHLLAGQEGNYINVIIEDDGKGLDYNKILQKALDNELLTYAEAQVMSEEEIKRLIFHSGFSTKDSVDEMSGRGVGMDVVKKSVEELNGTIILDTSAGHGTKITIKLPLTLAILNALIVRVGNDRFCIPMSSIVETQKVPMKNFLSVENNEMVRLRDSLIPVVRLDKIFPPELLGLEEDGQQPVGAATAPEETKEKSSILDTVEELPVIVVDYHNSQVAILVDQFINRQEMVIKSLSEHYRSIEGISGASILGDGSIILIIDVHGIIQLHQSKRPKSFQDFGSNVSAKDLELPSFKAKAEPKDEKPKYTPEKPAKKPATPPKPVTLTDISSMTPEEFEMLDEVEMVGKEPEKAESAEKQVKQPVSQPVKQILDMDPELEEMLLDDYLVEMLPDEINEMEAIHETMDSDHSFNLPVNPPALAMQTEDRIREIMQSETVQQEESELSDFERMKQLMELSDEVAIDKNLALSHFDSSTLDFEKLNKILDGIDEVNLKKWLKEANKKAIEGIKSLTGQNNIKPGKIHAKKFSQKKIMKHIEDLRMLNQEVVTLRLPILPLSGMIYLIFSEENAKTVCSMLFEAAQMPAPDIIDYEPLMEVTNILGSSYTNALTQVADIPIEPGLPDIVTGRELLKQQLSKDLARQKNRILFVENQFLWDNKSVLADILLIIPQIND